MDRSRFADVKSVESERLTVESFDGNTMILSAEPRDPRIELFSLEISKRSGKSGSHFSVTSVFSPEESVQQLRTMEPTSPEETNFVVEALSALESALKEESTRKEQQADTERLSICNNVFAAYRRLQVKDKLNADELKIYQWFQRAGSDIRVDDRNRLAQAIIAEGMQLSTKRRQLLVKMVLDEKAKGKTA